MGEGGGKAPHLDCSPTHVPSPGAASLPRWENEPTPVLPHPLGEPKAFAILSTPGDGPETFLRIHCVTEEHQLGACASPRDSLWALGWSLRIDLPASFPRP